MLQKHCKALKMWQKQDNTYKQLEKHKKCINMLKSMQTFSKCLKARKSLEISKSINRITKYWKKELWKCSKIMLDIAKCLQSTQHISKCSNICKNIWKWPKGGKMFKYVAKTYKTIPTYGKIMKHIPTWKAKDDWVTVATF